MWVVWSWSGVGFYFLFSLRSRQKFAAPPFISSLVTWMNPLYRFVACRRPPGRTPVPLSKRGRKYLFLNLCAETVARKAHQALVGERHQQRIGASVAQGGTAHAVNGILRRSRKITCLFENYFVLKGCKRVADAQSERYSNKNQQTAVLLLCSASILLVILIFNSDSVWCCYTTRQGDVVGGRARTMS